MLRVDLKSGICEVSGKANDVLIEYSILVSVLKHKSKIPTELLIKLGAVAMTDMSLLQDAKEFTKEDFANLMGELEKMKKENEEKEENQKENE